MPNLSCWSCGRQIYTVAPLRSLFAEERRCPRCGADLHEDRRETERRSANRRLNPADDPGPPKATPRGKANGTDGPATNGLERRAATRRSGQRRGGSRRTPPPTAGANDSSGWKD